MKINKVLWCTACIGTMSVCFDNRFTPAESSYLILSNKTKSYVHAAPFATFNTIAYTTNEKEISPFELYGNLDLGALGRAIHKVTGTNPLDSYFHDKNIPCTINSSLYAQGVSFALYHQMIDQIGFGVQFSYAHQQSEIQPSIDSLNFVQTTAIIEQLEKDCKTIFKSLNIAMIDQVHDFHDLNLYFRFGSIWDYALSFKRINAGLQCGVLIPTGIKRNLNRPASITHFSYELPGFYTALELLLELKDDFKFGLFAGISKRFSKSFVERISVLGEPYLFGASTANYTFNPGASFICTPYFLFEHIRSGLGVGVFYTLNFHLKDQWSLDQQHPLYNTDNIDHMIRTSTWASDYVGLQLMYDFNKDFTENNLRPLLSFRWDIPVNFFVTKRVAKTHRISLSIEYDY